MTSSAAQPRRSTVEIPGLRVGVLEWGPADGPLALCLHGFPDTAWSWRHLAPALAADGWRVVAPFSRGYAPTSLAPDGSYQTGALVSDVVALHAALGGDERAVLLGHDWGAITAYGVGAFAPTLFARIVTMAVPPIPAMAARRRHPAVLARQARSSWYIAYNHLPGLSERTLPWLVRRLWQDWSPGYDAEQDLAHVADALDTGARRTAALRYYRAWGYPWLRSPTYAAEQARALGVPQVPTLYLHGDRDGCLRPELAEGAASALPAGSTAVTIAGAGHFLQLEQPEQALAAIRPFLAAEE
ncbi:alpha/beta fold hydrolase [Rhodococcus sp. X156]|uniref:alpha/beta fold hydrolase n=1 Tax=Rhodococcus sp. X156 TaxID=2499145 RepID=UPI000FD8DCD8|nr:alpha/beta fold hydrolase [Rhodococcus sp. X156]